jgi:hypothetical protein
LRLLRGASPAALIFFAVLAATLAIAVLVVRARSPDLALEVTRWKPCTRELSSMAEGEAGRVRITFFIRENEEHALVRIVDSEERTVRTLDADLALAAREKARYYWDGTDDEGETVRPGLYRLGVTLPAHDREMVWPRRIGVDRSQAPDDDALCEEPN